MRRMKSYIIAVFCVITVLSCCSCAGGGKGQDRSAGSVNFMDYSPEVKADGDVAVYAYEGMTYFKESVALPEGINYSAVFDGKLYYMDTFVGFETGEIRNDNSKCRLLCRDLDETYENAETVFAWIDISAMGNLMIQEGFLYASWQTTGDEMKRIVIELESGETTEVSILRDKRLEAFTGEEYYYEEGNKIYSCKFSEEEGVFFCETEGEVRDIYINGDTLCVITEGETGIVLQQFGEDGTLEQRYSDLEQVGADFTGHYPCFVKAEGDFLFYQMHCSSDMENGGENTFLVQMNLITGEKEILGGWYMP